MKRMILLLCALLIFCSVAQAEGEFVRNARNIPEELEIIPESYKMPTEQAGSLELLTYDTWESFTYDQHTQKLTKEAWVYVPYGYDEADADTRYNVLYLMHGHGGALRDQRGPVPPLCGGPPAGHAGPAGSGAGAHQ